MNEEDDEKENSGSEKKNMGEKGPCLNKKRKREKGIR